MAVKTGIGYDLVRAGTTTGVIKAVGILAADAEDQQEYPYIVVKLDNKKMMFFYDFGHGIRIAEDFKPGDRCMLVQGNGVYTWEPDDAGIDSMYARNFKQVLKDQEQHHKLVAERYRSRVPEISHKPPVAPRSKQPDTPGCKTEMGVKPAPQGVLKFNMVPGTNVVRNTKHQRTVIIHTPMKPVTNEVVTHAE